MASLFELGRASREVWIRRAQLSAERPFLRFEGKRWTYGEADLEIRRLAAGLAGLGLRQGARVLVGMSNRAETLFVHFAIRHLGAVVVGLVAGATFDELSYPIVHSEAEWLIADDPIASQIAPRRDAFPKLSHLILLGPCAAGTPEGCLGYEAIRAAQPIGEVRLEGYDDLSPAEILYTSGSTSRPKGVILPAGSLVSGGFGYADRFQIRPDDNFLLPFTFAHGTAALIAPGITLKTGGQLTILERMNPALFWDQVETNGATVVLLFPAQINLLMSAPNAPAKGASCLRMEITHEWIEDFWQRFGIPMATTWGSTETGATGAGSGPGFRGDRGPGYLGRPFPEPETEVATFDTAGQRLPAGTQGEIRLRHRHIMLEYLKEPTLTAETVVDGWVRTGDLGVIDASGEVRYQGRLKSMIKRSGENISPAEVETVIDQHPAVSESVVFGVADAVRKEEVAAVVSIAAGMACDAAGLMGFLQGKISKAKLPRYLKIIDTQLPRLMVGKIDRTAVVNSFDPASFWDARATGKDQGNT